LNVTAGKLKVILDGTNTGTSQLSSLSITTSANAQFNLRNNAVIVNGGTSPTATDSQIRSYLISGRNVPTGGTTNIGTWNGPGITSSSASNDNSVASQEVKTVAYALNSTLPASYTTFMGQPVTLSDILIRFTLNGDLNLDGLVNSTDYNTLLQFDDNGATTGHEWDQGDLNCDGKVDSSDLTIMQRFYNPNTNTTATLSFAAPAQVVPEPNALALLAGVFALLPRRRRRHQAAPLL